MPWMNNGSRRPSTEAGNDATALRQHHNWADPGDDSLPPPPQAQAVNDEAVFQLALVLNHYDTGLVVPVTQRNGAFFISSADLLRAGLPRNMCPPAR